jgi:hypothetical protein
MAVVKSVIKGELLSLYDLCVTGSGIDATAFADNMADVIRNAVISADVNTTLTPGTATATDPVSGALPVIGGSSTGGLT